jgi:hypothetical protein
MWMSVASATGKYDTRRCLAWLTPARLFAYGTMIAIGYCILAGSFYVMAVRQAGQGQMPTVIDFNTFYAVPLLLAQQPAEAAYDQQTLRQFERQAVTRAFPGVTDAQMAPVPPFRWLYPPTALLSVAPLGLLPYWPAYLLWVAATLVVWLAAVHRIFPGRPALAVALALPATFLNAAFGQMGFLVAGLMGLGLVWLDRRPVLAGIAFGLMTMKPHFGLLLPIALLCGGHWRSIAAACATALGLAAVSLLAWGPAPWQAFLAGSGVGGRLLDGGNVPWTLMPTVFPSLRLLGAGSTAAAAAQAVAAAIGLGTVIWGWRRPGPPELKAALLCLATLLAVPFAYAYDLVILTLPIFWLARVGLSRPVEVATIGAAGLLPFLGPGLAKLGVPIGPLVIGGFLVVIIDRLRRSEVVTRR